MSEEWRNVVGYEGLYEVSNLGRVRSVDREQAAMNRWGKLSTRRLKGRILRPASYPTGHLHVTLVDGRRREDRQVHRLVLIAFVGPAPEGMECLHYNGDPTDNRLENLRWGTRAENVADARRHGTIYGNRRGDHCARGHEYTPKNTYMRPGGRQCRTCSNLKKRERRARLRLAAV